MTQNVICIKTAKSHVILKRFSLTTSNLDVLNKLSFTWRVDVLHHITGLLLPSSCVNNCIATVGAWGVQGLPQSKKKKTKNTHTHVYTQASITEEYLWRKKKQWGGRGGGWLKETLCWRKVWSEETAFLQACCSLAVKDCNSFCFNAICLTRSLAVHERGQIFPDHLPTEHSLPLLFSSI